MDIESYIKDLSPELQEKARACTSTDELLKLAQDSGAPVPPEALSAIAGGADEEVGDCKGTKCPKCGSKDVDTSHDWEKHEEWHHCNKCGYNWSPDV